MAVMVLLVAVQRSTLYLARQFGYGISNHFIGIKTSVFHAYFWAKISYSRGNINLADVMYIFAVTMSMIKNTFKWIEKAASAQKCDLYSAFNFQHPPSLLITSTAVLHRSSRRK